MSFDDEDYMYRMGKNEGSKYTYHGCNSRVNMTVAVPETMTD